MKIAIIGAGGYVFPLRLIEDILSFEELQVCHLALQDIDFERLDRVASVARRLVEMHGLPTRVDSHVDQRAAVADADFVIVTFQVGGLEAYRLDIEIPRKYGLDQTVGDTIGPGGVFRGLRSMAVLDELCTNMKSLSNPHAILLNYANPMAINCWSTSLHGVSHVGLCHSIQGTSALMARVLGIAADDVVFRAAGINHQSWFLEFRHKSIGEDLAPKVREIMARETLEIGEPSKLQRTGIYEGPGNDLTRTAILEYVVGTGAAAFISESPHHTSEYFPYFRKDRDETRRWIKDRWDYLEICKNHDATGQVEDVLGRTRNGFRRSNEYGAWIIHSVATNTPRVIYGNVPNTGLITNLQDGCCVEVPCLVDANGVQPTFVGNLPPACAALNRTNINVQELAVLGHARRDLDLIKAAVAVDPLTAAVVPLQEIPRMVDEMFTAQKRWLGQF